MEQMEMPNYVNVRPKPGLKSSAEVNQTVNRLCWLVLISFGALCIVQAALNISLRLTLYSSKESANSNTTLFSDPDKKKVQPDCERRSGQFNKLQERFNALIAERNRIQNQNSELNNRIRAVEKERDRLKMEKQSNSSTDCSRTYLSELPMDCKRRSGQFNELQERFNILTAEKNQIQNQNSQLNNRIRAVEQERDRLKTEQQSNSCSEIRFNELRQDCERRSRHCNELQERFNALTAVKNQSQNQNSVLNNRLRAVVQERDRLKIDQLKPRVGATCQPCPAGWKPINSRCYFLSTEQKSWQESRQDCQNKGADLVVINSQQEQAALYRLDGDQWLLFWIGLKATGGTFKWVDGSALTTPFWQSGQPDQGGPNNTEDCVEMYHHDPKLANWNDARCGDKRRWLCEKDDSTC